MNVLRKKELKILLRVILLSSVTVFFWVATPLIVNLSTFAVYTLVGNELTAAKAFGAVGEFPLFTLLSSTALFNIMEFPLNAIPFLIGFLVDAKVSMNRLYKYLLEEEMDLDAVSTLEEKSSLNSIEMENASFAWDDAPTLQDLSFQVQQSLSL